ncbi:MAG TPA: hypothetical protein VH855_17890 [Acetobacteraceae bacterium]|jgi:hypothetical protein
MSATQSDVVSVPAPSRRFADQHPQLAPFAVAVIFAAASVLVSLAITGLPA